MTYVLDGIGADGGLELELDDVSDSHDSFLLNELKQQINWIE